MRDLPAEIYMNIFRHLEKKDLQACYYVCKSWYTILIPLSWEAVTLRIPNISLLKSIFNAFFRKRSFKYGHFITKIAFDDTNNRGDSDKFSKPELLELLNRLPNLKEIDFRGTKYTEEYLEYLLGADMQNINRIYTGYNLCDIRSDLLFSLYYKFRDSITRIDLAYTRKTVNINSQKINILDSLNSITEFKKLTELHIYNLYDINLTPFVIQDNCPNLERLKFCSFHPISESAMRHVLDDSRRINLNFISSLTYFNLYLPSLSATYTRYLVDYFPNQLTDFLIKITHQNIYNWIDTVGMELALRLMEKAGRIDESYIIFAKSEEYPIQTDIENNMTKYFKLLNSFRGTRQTHCTAHFNDAIQETKRLGYSFRYDSLDKLFVTYTLYRCDLYRFNTADMAVPDKTISIIGLEIFDVLEFNLLYRYDSDVYPLLNYSLSNCPRLKSLNIMYNDDGRFHSSLSFGHKESKISSNQANCDINFLQIEQITPAKTLFDLVTTHLHNIEVVSLKVKDRDSNNHIPVVDLTGFKKLKSFKYTSITKFLFPVGNKSFLIKYTNGTERHTHEYDAETKKIGHPSFTILCDISVSLDFRREHGK